jgi:hypothetical protein
MKKDELYNLTINLFECSKEMKKLDETCSDILLHMASQTLVILEKANLPDDIKEDIDKIKLEILAEGVE